MDIRAARPLYGIKRGKALEIIVSGLVGVTRHGKLVTPEIAGVKMVSRSILKPWQFLAADVFGDEDFWAIGLASSSGQQIHLDALAALKKATGVSEAGLVCAETMPYDPNLAAQMRLRGEPKSRLYHFCCGKHLTMQHACRVNGWDATTYHRRENPLQQKLAALVTRILGGEEPDWMVDSCGLPTLYCSVLGHLRLWDDLGASSEPRVKQMRDLWARQPRLVGGFGRLDSDIVELTEGRILVKEGADGVLALQTVSEKNESQMGVLIKLVHGFNDAEMGLVLWTELMKWRDDLPKAFKRVLDYLDNRKKDEWVQKDQTFVTAEEF